MQLFNDFQLQIEHQLLGLVHVRVVVVGGVGFGDEACWDGGLGIISWVKKYMALSAFCFRDSNFVFVTPAPAPGCCCYVI